MRPIIALVVTFLVLPWMPIGSLAQSSFTCDDFTNQAQANIMLNPTTADQLDPDGDGVPCEDLPQDAQQLSNPLSPERPYQGLGISGGNDCSPAPPPIVAQIEAGMSYYDIWLQAAQVRSADVVQAGAWVVSSDVGGPEFEGNTDIGHWLVINPNSDFVSIYKIDSGHADYLSALPSSSTIGFDPGFWESAEVLGPGIECAQEAAEDTGALGIDRDTWEERFGSTVDTLNGFATTDGVATFTVTDGRVAGVTWTLANPVAVDDCRAISRNLIPDDALLAGTSATGPRQYPAQPDIYQSEWLSDRYDGTTIWNGAPAGTLSVTYTVSGGLCSALVVHLGEP